MAVTLTLFRALAGWLAAASRFCPTRLRNRISPARLNLAKRERVRICGLTKSQAEELLDWLEANGCQVRRLCYFKDKGFTVSLG